MADVVVADPSIYDKVWKPVSKDADKSTDKKDKSPKYEVPAKDQGHTAGDIIYGSRSVTPSDLMLLIGQGKPYETKGY